MGVKEKEEHEVVVTYGDELESILRKAAVEGRKSLIEEILNGEVTSHNLIRRFENMNISDPSLAELGEEEGVRVHGGGGHQQGGGY